MESHSSSIYAHAHTHTHAHTHFAPSPFHTSTLVATHLHPHPSSPLPPCMDSSLALRLQQAWLHEQLRSSSSSSSSSSSHFSSAQLPPWSPSPSPDSPASWQSEVAGLSESWDDCALPTTSSSSSSSSDSSWGTSCSPYRGPSSASSDPWMPGNHHTDAIGGATPAAETIVAETPMFANDVLMDPVLEFISDMLTDEQMEDRKCMQQECMSYQAIVNGLGDECSPQPSLCRDQQRTSGDGFMHTEFKQKFGVARDGYKQEEEDYGWIDDVLVADPSAEGKNAGEQAWTMEHIDSIFNGVEQDSKQWTWSLEMSSSSSSEQDMKVWSLDSSLSSSPYSQDSPTGLLDHTNFVVAPAMVTLPALNHTSIAHALPIAPLLQNFWQKETLHLNADLSSGNSHDSRISTTHDCKDLQREGLPSNAVNNSALADGAKPARLESPPDEQPLSFVKNEYLNAEKHAKIYGDWSPAQDECAAKKKEARNSKPKRKGKPEPLDLRSLLVECAQAVGANNLRKANEIVQELRQHVSPLGTASQRLAHYFTEGLVARLAGTGAQLYTAMSNNRPSAANMLKAYRLVVEVCPYAKLAHFFANQNILKVAEGASRVHIVDFGILYGVQWPCLISALAERKGGPPFLRITGIEFPQPGLNPAERVEETGRRLAEYAKAYNVPFEYQAIATKWEDVEPAALNLREGEVLVVNCIQRLRHLMDETVVSPSPRRKVLSMMHSLKPDIVLIAVVNAGYNAPFFVSRFREALYHYSSKFDMIDTTVADSENPQRLMMERECMGRDILNVVACEGPERVERPETYRQWQARFQRAGFEPRPLSSLVLTKARDVVKAFYHKDFTVDDDSKWMLLGWKGRIVEGLSAWKPSASSLVI